MKRIRVKQQKRRKNPGKGAAYERKTCQTLSLWVSRLRREDVFWRSAMSGGRATLRTRKARGSTPRRIRDKHGKVQAITHDAHCGDIVATHSLGNLLTSLYVLECKHYADLQIVALFYGKERTKVAKFWAKVSEEARSTGRQPMMICRQNNQADVLCTTKQGKLPLTMAVRRGETLSPIAFLPRLGMWVYKLRDVLTAVDFDAVRRAREHPEVIKSHFKEK